MKEIPTIKTVLGNDELSQEYIELLISRLTHSSMSLEKDLGNVDDSKNAIRLRDNMKAFKYLLNKLQSDELLSKETIMQCANMVNESAIYISSGYRTYGNTITDTDIPISDANEIEKDMDRIIAEYNNDITTGENAFIREAKFHINFIRIHPFEDGNGRTGRLLLNHNLLREDIAPVIITDDLIEYYQSYIREKDIKGMANLFSIQSKKEQEVIEKLVDIHISKQTDIEAPEFSQPVTK